MNKKKKVVLIGWHPEVLDYSQRPDLTPDKLLAALQTEKNTLNDLGYEANLLFIYDAVTAYDSVANLLKEETYDCVLIGAGVRAAPEHLIVFEHLVNAVHKFAPAAKICFNTNPGDTTEAVQRCI